MPGFDPKAYAAGHYDEPAEKSGFDPKAYAAGHYDEPVPIDAEKPDAVDAAISGVANGMTFGLAPKIIGGTRALYNKATEGGDLKQLYDKYRKEQEGYDEGAEKASPKVNTAANFAGGLLNPVNKFLPGGSLGKNVATGAGVGAVNSAAKSKHDLSNYDEATGLAKDTLIGAGIGAGAGVIGTGLQKGVEAAPNLVKKGLSVMLGASEDAVNRLVKNPEAVETAVAVPEHVNRIKGLIERLRGDVTEGSAAARGTLGPEAGHTGKEIHDFFQNKIDDIVRRSEGALSPEQAVTVKFLEAQKAPFASEENLAKTFSGSRVKDLIQSLQKKGNYQLPPGEFSAPNDAIIKEVTGNINASLKGRAPQYGEDMQDVARKTGLLNDVQEKFKTDQGLAGLLDRVRRGRAPFAEETFQKLDQEFGTQTVEDLRNALAKEAFNKGAQNGSKNVNLYKEIIGDWAERNHIPMGRAMGAIFGAAVDKYGPGMARTGIRAYRATADNPTLQSYAQGLGEMGAKTGLSPNLNPAIAEYLTNKYSGGRRP